MTTWSNESVESNSMRAVSIISLCFASLTIGIGGGCTSVPVHNPDRPDVALQLQKATALAAGRYTDVLRSLEGGKLEGAKNDIDWWLDQSIIELEFLEERYPHGDWAAVQPRDSPLRMGSFYKRIAQFRRDHPRRHSVPLDPESLKRIEIFVQKYQ